MFFESWQEYQLKLFPVFLDNEKLDRYHTEACLAQIIKLVGPSGDSHVRSQSIYRTEPAGASAMTSSAAELKSDYS